MSASRPDGELSPYRILERKRAGSSLGRAEIEAAVVGAASGAWNDAQMGAFLMAAAIRGLDRDETATLTLAMLHSGDTWQLRDEFPTVVDKHSTGGVGDKTSMILGPLLAACDQPVAMLTGRALGHTAGTADKLESLPGIDLALDRARTAELLDRVGLAIGIATADIAPADRRIYSLRDQTATVDSIPLVVGSILSKKLATGAAGIVFDVKIGRGAIFPDPAVASELAATLVSTAEELGCVASALLTDMAQPLGRWVGHSAEMRECAEVLRGESTGRLVELTLALAEEASALVGGDLRRERLESALSSGAAWEHFLRWAEAQGVEKGWLAEPEFPLAAVETVVLAPTGGVLAAVDNRAIGLGMAELARLNGRLDHSVALQMLVELGDEVAAGQPLARLYARDAPSEDWTALFEIAATGVAPPLIAGGVDRRIPGPAR